MRVKAAMARTATQRVRLALRVVEFMMV